MFTRRRRAIGDQDLCYIGRNELAELTRLNRLIKMRLEVVRGLIWSVTAATIPKLNVHLDNRLSVDVAMSFFGDKHEDWVFNAAFSGSVDYGFDLSPVCDNIRCLPRSQCDNGSPVGRHLYCNGIP